MHYYYTDIRVIWPDNISVSTLNNSPLFSVIYLTSLSASAKLQLASKCQPSFLSPNLDSPNTYARIVFIGYSSAFNTIIPDKLFSKLRQLSINSRMCQWILNVLLDRRQVVKVNTLLSQPLILSTGAPQGCVLSPLLYSLFTNDCRSNNYSTLVFTFSDDTPTEGLITNTDETVCRSEVDRLVD